MWNYFIFFLYAYFFATNMALVIAFGVATVTLVAASIAAYRLKSGGVFFSLLSITFGGVIFTFVWCNAAAWHFVPFLGLLAIVVGMAYLLFFLCIRVWERKRRRKEEREKQARQLRYTLPQRDNTFIRARLNTTLNEETEDMETDGEAMQLHFSYMKKLIVKLREKQVAMSERLEIEELSKVFALYMEKEKYAAEDVRILGEAFSRVLKLSAKYGV